MFSPTGGVELLIEGSPIPASADLARMRRARGQRLQAELERQGLDGLVLLGTSSVAYATGVRLPGLDSGRAALVRSVAVVIRGEAWPQLFTPFPGGAPPELPEDRIHAGVVVDTEDGVSELVPMLGEWFPPGARLGVDDSSHLLGAALSGWEVVSASAVMGAAKLRKTPDEVACIRTAQRINEMAMSAVVAELRPGLRQIDLTATFLRRVHELGATSNGIDPIWQVMPPTRSAGPWTTHGDLAFPTPTSDRFLRDGDVIWVDTGIHYEGYASDFGRTWLVGSDPRPSDRQRGQFERWMTVVDAVRDLCKPGVSALELGRAAISANGGTKPWIEHFYLGHGVGTDSAEMPLVGTDLGERFDERLVMQPGMVLVLEPVIWDDGASGYRAEDILVITDDGWAPLSDNDYWPFDAS